MAQKSYPWPGVAPGSGADAGRYTAPEWWGEWAAEQLTSGIVVTSPLLRVDTTFTNVGVHYAIGNQLAVTSPGNNQITVDTGAWTNDGQFGYNDTAISAIAITSPAANPRIDRVIVRKNYTGNTYTPTNAASETVGPTTARVTIISGSEAASPVAPSLVQDTARDPSGVFGTDGTWDIPLAQYEISTGGVISGLTDEREYVDAETKEVLVPFTGGDSGGALDLDNAVGWTLSASATTDLWAFWEIPVDFISTLVVTPLVGPEGAAGNWVMTNDINYGTCGQSVSAHNDAVTDTVAAGTVFQFDCVTDMSVSISAATIGDFLRMRLRRSGADGADTAGVARGIGMIVSYLGWKR